MRQINYYLGALAVAPLGLWSCSSDDLGGEEPNGPGTDVERTVYVNVAIHGENPSSRAAGTDGNPAEGTVDGDKGDFADGSVRESEVGSCYLVFYDAQGNTVGSVVEVDGLPWNPVTAPNGTVETRAQKVVTVTLQQGDANPAQVVCYINPANPSDLQNPLSTLQTITRNAVTLGSGENLLFPMSNSVYYPAQEGSTTATAEAPHMAVQIPENAIFDTEEAANKALTDNTDEVLNIYVERYAAKLQMHFAANVVEPYKTVSTQDGPLGVDAGKADVPVELTFVVDGWDVNGEAKTTYPVKSFRQVVEGGQISGDNYKFTDLDGRINAKTFDYNATTGEVTVSTEKVAGVWDWNNFNYHRSYWACSPVYFQAEYPEVLSDYKGNEDKYNQEFKSWTQIAQGSKQKDTYYYFKETTSGIPALRSKNPNAAIPTIALVGHYELKVNNTLVTNADGTAATPTFYTYQTASVEITEGTETKEVSRPVIYFATTSGDKKDVAESAVAGGLSMHKRFLWQTTVLYKNTALQGQPAVYERFDVSDEGNLKTLVAATTIARPSDKVLGTVKMTSVARTLQLIDNVDNLKGIYVNDNGTPKEIVANDVVLDEEGKKTKINLDDANRILWRNVNTCNLYVEAAGKFTIPVKHLGWYRQGNEQKNSTTIDMSLAHVGDFGLVRNHAYTISVDKIKGLAAGIGGKDDPIIPPADTRDVYTAYRINILRWAVVPTQKVEL